MHCRECGESIFDDDKFCEHCGSPVGKEPKGRPKPRSRDDDNLPVPTPVPAPTPRPRSRYDDEEDFDDRGRLPRDRDGRGRDRDHGNICPDCGEDLKYIEQYRSYWCERCQRYASDSSRPPSRGHDQDYPYPQGQPPPYGPPHGAYPQRKFSIVFLVFEILALLTMIGALITTFEDLYIISAILWLITALFFGIAGAAQYFYRKKHPHLFPPQQQYQPPGNYR